MKRSEEKENSSGDQIKTALKRRKRKEVIINLFIMKLE
jgi:hypothetical protein